VPEPEQWWPDSVVLQDGELPWWAVKSGGEKRVLNPAEGLKSRINV
jgi:hypothetical protein